MCEAKIKKHPARTLHVRNVDPRRFLPSKVCTFGRSGGVCLEFSVEAENGGSLNVGRVWYALKPYYCTVRATGGGERC